MQKSNTTSSSRPIKRDVNKMTRDDATKLYRDLGAQMLSSSDQDEAAPSVANRNKSRLNMANLQGMKAPTFRLPQFPKIQGRSAAFMLVVVFACAKVGISAMDYFGVASVPAVEAAMISSADANMVSPQAIDSQPQPRNPAEIQQLTKEDLLLLNQLDKRRADLEQRADRLKTREQDLEARERELVTKMNELRSLTDKLKANREQGDRRKDAQLDQLSKVYSAMAPEEAAHLMEQLDISIALPLLQKMPEKRIGQILALISPERALAITKLLSGRVGE